MDVIVGAGPAGRTCALVLGKAGKKVLLIDRKGRKGVGGKCLNEACTVVGALIEVARLVAWSRLGIPGIELSVEVDYRELARGLRRALSRVRSRLIRELREAGVELTRGEVERVEEGPAVVVDGDRVEAEHVFLATGSRPRVPDVEGVDLDGVVTYRDLLSLDLPGEVCVVGGGPTALELAFVLAALGAEVTLVYRSRLLPGYPRRVVREALRDLELVGVEVVRGGGLRKIRETSSGLECEFEHGFTVSDVVLLGTGLRPNSEVAVRSGIRVNEDGAVVVDERMRTSRPGVYAAGDVTGPPYLTPVARYEGLIAALNALGHRVRRGHPPMPRVVRLLRDIGRTEVRTAWEGHREAPAGGPSFWLFARGLGGLLLGRRRGERTELFTVGPHASAFLHYADLALSEGPRRLEVIEVHPTTDPLIHLVKELALREILGD